MCNAAQRAPAPLNGKNANNVHLCPGTVSQNALEELAMCVLLHLPSGLCSLSRCCWGKWKQQHWIRQGERALKPGGVKHPADQKGPFQT